MDMVFYAANGNRITTNILYDASYIGEDLRQVFVFYADTSALNVEHDVNV